MRDDFFGSFRLEPNIQTPTSSTKKNKYMKLGIPHVSLRETPWQKLLRTGDDSQFLMAVALSRSLFLDTLLPWFHNKRFDIHGGSPYRHGNGPNGRKPLLRSVDILGLALTYIRTSDILQELCRVFGVTPSTISDWLW